MTKIREWSEERMFRAFRKWFGIFILPCLKKRAEQIDRAFGKVGR